MMGRLYPKLDFVWPGDVYGVNPVDGRVADTQCESRCPAIAGIGHPGTPHVGNFDYTCTENADQGLFVGQPKLADVGRISPSDIPNVIQLSNVDGYPSSSGSGVYSGVGNIIGIVSGSQCFEAGKGGSLRVASDEMEKDSSDEGGD